MKKPQLIEQILKLTKAKPEDHINYLSDNSEKHLTKLLSVIKLLKSAV